MQFTGARARRTNGHVGAGHVVVDRTNETDNVEVLVGVVLLLRDIACKLRRLSDSLKGKVLRGAKKQVPAEGRTTLKERLNVLRPLRTQAVRAGERAVTTADNECVDAVADEVEGSLAAALNLAESGAARGADERAANRSEAANVVPADLRGSSQVSVIAILKNGARHARG